MGEILAYKIYLNKIIFLFKNQYDSFLIKAWGISRKGYLFNPQKGKMNPESIWKDKL